MLGVVCDFLMMDQKPSYAMPLFRLALITPKVEMTQRHCDELEDEINTILGTAENLVLLVPDFSPEPAQSFPKILSRRGKYSGRISIEPRVFSRPYLYADLATWAMSADRIMAFPSRATCGRIVDRVWGTTQEIKRRGGIVVISYPKDK